MKPSSFILDLLRTYEHRGASLKNLMSAATLFNFSDNLTRVTLSRLVARGLIEKVKRGHYRLAQRSDPLNDFVEQWRLGEARSRLWKPNTFLIASVESSDRNNWVMSATGFVRLRDQLWSRPDNLARQGDELSMWLHHLGLSEDALIGSQVVFSDDQCHSIIKQYNLTDLENSYLTLIGKLQQSEARLNQMPKEKAMKESFSLGGEALQALAKDPYLPQDVINPEDRITLWQTMMRYDELGRSIWSESPATLPMSKSNYF
jgi:phenylacetic acid degradation operon negative regulatory protein